MFGGNATFAKAQADVGNTLVYESRFLRNSETDYVIADREFNVRGIAKAAMGPNSVVDIPMATPNKLSAILAPQGSRTLVRADLITLNRRQERLSESEFDCSEVVREIVAPVGQSVPTANPASLIKEIDGSEHNIKEKCQICQ